MAEYPEFDKEPSAPHCVINSMVDGGRFECENCGADYLPALPCPMNVYLSIANTWIGDHRMCEVRTENRMGNARLPKALREEEDEVESTEQECEHCEEGFTEGGRTCGNPSAGGCIDGMCGGCYAVVPCSYCNDDHEEPEPDYDAIADERRDERGQDEVEWESPE